MLIRGNSSPGPILYVPTLLALKSSVQRRVSRSNPNGRLVCPRNLGRYIASKIELSW